jgi:GNAT superfamily N-acetyltransferase
LIRNANRDDIPRIMQIRAGVRENRLRDPSRVTVDEVRSYVDNYEIFVWVEGQKIVGFSAADARNGNIFGLFVEEGHEGRGIGRALFERACDVLVEAGCPAERVTRSLFKQVADIGQRRRWD